MDGQRGKDPGLLHRLAETDAAAGAVAQALDGPRDDLIAHHLLDHVEGRQHRHAAPEKRARDAGETRHLGLHDDGADHGEPQQEVIGLEPPGRGRQPDPDGERYAESRAGERPSEGLSLALSERRTEAGMGSEIA